MKEEALKEITKMQKRALRSKKFHLRNGDPYKLAFFFEGKRAALRQVKRLIKTIE